MSSSEILLNTGLKIPQIGLGLWKVPVNDMEKSVTAAVESGYRLFDTAQIYGNEQALPKVLAKAGIERKDVFITTKISIYNFMPGQLQKSFTESLAKLQTDHVDLLLLHFPISLLRGHAWKELEKIFDSGRAKNIGVSNYTIRHLKQLLEDCRIKPAVNQVELHVHLQQPELLEYCKENEIAVEAYSPLAHGQEMDHPVLSDLATKYHKSNAQIMLRWCIEKGTIPLPKSVTPERVKENIEIFDFKLDNEDMEKLKALNRGLRTCWDPTLTP